MCVSVSHAVTHVVELAESSLCIFHIQYDLSAVTMSKQNFVEQYLYIWKVSLVTDEASKCVLLGTVTALESDQLKCLTKCDVKFKNTSALTWTTSPESPWCPGTVGGELMLQAAINFREEAEEPDSSTRMPRLVFAPNTAGRSSHPPHMECQSQAPLEEEHFQAFY